MPQVRMGRDIADAEEKKKRTAQITRDAKGRDASRQLKTRRKGKEGKHGLRPEGGKSDYAWRFRVYEYKLLVYYLFTWWSASLGTRDLHAD